MITLFPAAKSFAAFVWQKKPNKCEPKTKMFQTETETSTTAVFPELVDLVSLPFFPQFVGVLFKLGKTQTTEKSGTPFCTSSG
jgi:hypothetical protein